jgi:hypothetical protein
MALHKSIIGKLHFIAQNSKLENSLMYTNVHHFYKTNPTAKMDMKNIIRYLIYTKEKGLTLEPTKHLSLNLNMYADFASM